MSILMNAIVSFLGYKDNRGVVSNPLQKNFDWSRRFMSIPAKSGTSDDAVIAPGQSMTIFDGTVPLPQALDLTTVISISQLSTQNSTYRVLIASGSGELKTARTTGLKAASSLSIAVNNNAIATLTINSPTTETFASVQVGDIVRIKGFNTGDVSGAVFSSVNSGYWVIIANNGAAQLTMKRPAGQVFQGTPETEVIGATDTQNQVLIYAPDGVQVGNSVSIAGTLSPATWGTYSVLHVAPLFFDIISGVPLPQESILTLATINDILFYSDAKKFMYIEADQNAAVRINSQVDSNNLINPIQIGQECVPGFFCKWGAAYKCTLVNLSQTDSNSVKWILVD